MKTSVETRARAAFVIVLLLGALGGFGWYLIASGEYTTFQIRTQDPVSGLIVDAPVEFHGVEVGKVKHVELVDARSVTVLLSVKKSAPVTSATIATITGRGLATRGFTGYVYVSLENLGSDSRPLVAAAGSPYAVIATAPSQSVNLDTAISQLSRNVQSMTDLLQSVMDQKTVASLKQSVDGLERVTKSSDETLRILQTQILPEAYRTLSKLDNLATAASDLTAKINRDPSVLIRGGKAAAGPGETR